MTDEVRLLVTAVGSELSFSVLKAARLASLPLRLIGCDMRPQVVGRYWCRSFAIVPPASREEEYLASLKTLVQREGIQVLVPTADAELPVLARHKDTLAAELGCRVLVNPLEELERFSDKWHAARWYEEQGIPAPRTLKPEHPDQLGEAARELGLPLVLKPRVGGGSRHLFVVHSLEELRRCFPVVPDPILQQYLPPEEDGEEYTAGTYRCRDGQVYVIILRRVLKFGMTNYARSVVDRPDLEEFCRGVIQKTNLVGSNNIQFRVGPEGPQVVEINPRFSGTTGIRAHCGFNDLEMWLREELDLGRPEPPVIKKRLVTRYMEELYLEPAAGGGWRPVVDDG